MARDEANIIVLCDRVLGRKALRQHRFDFLRRDTERTLPVDAYYPDLSLVTEYHERQHLEDIVFWNRKPTASGIPRGEQRVMYDQRRRDILRQHSITVVELSCFDFECDARKRLLRLRSKDERVVRRKLARWVKVKLDLRLNTRVVRQSRETRGVSIAGVPYAQLKSRGRLEGPMQRLT